MSKSLALGIVIGASISGSVGSAFKTLNTKIGDAEKAVNKAKIGKALAADVIQYKQKLERLKAAQQQFGLSNTKLWPQIAATEKRYRSASSAALKYGIDVGKVVRQHDLLGQSALRSERKLARLQSRQLNQSRRSELKSSIPGVVGLAFAAASPLKVAIDFEQSMARLGAITQGSTKEIELLTLKARSLGETTQFSASQASEGMLFLGMAGFSTNQILAATPGVLNLAQAAGSDLGQTANIASNILSGFNLEAREMGRLGDVLSSTFTSSNTTLEQLGDAMKFVAPAASAAGANIEEVAGQVALLANVGIQGSLAGTALRASYLRLVTPATQKQLSDLGVAVTDANGNMRNMPAILTDIGNATKGLGNAEKLATITKIFGVEAASAMVELTKQATNGALQKYIAKLRESHGVTQKMAEQMGNTTQGSIKRMGSALESLQITLGSLLLPAIASVATGAAVLFGKLSVLGQSFPLLTQVVVGLAVGFVALKIVTLGTKFAFTVLFDGVLIAKEIMDFFRLSTLRANISLVTQKALLIGTAIKQKALAVSTAVVTAAQWLWNTALISGGVSLAATAGKAVFFGGIALAGAAKIGVFTAAQWLWNAALMANPIGLVIAAVVGLAAIAFTVYKNWEPIKLFFQNLWKGIQLGAEKAINFVGDKIKMVKQFFGFSDDSDSESVGKGKKTVASAALGIALSAPTAALPSPVNTAASPASVVNQQQYNININQQPGESADELARRVVEIQQEDALRQESDV